MLLAALCGVLAGTPADANAQDQEPMRLVPSMDLSPDGKQLVVAWRGDLWIASTSGGEARRLTHHPANDHMPWVSPDGTRVAFLSNRTGVDQVWLIALDGGPAKQVTHHTEGFGLYGWFPSGDAVLVRARHDHHWRQGLRFFKRTLDPIDPLELLFDAYGGSASISPDGKHIVFAREGERWWRKGYVGPRASQIWTYDLEKKTFRKLTDGEHGERWPLWIDSDSLYFVSQADGTFNLWRMNRDGTKRKQLTFLKDDGVMFPHVSADRSTLVFRRLFDLYTYDPKEGGEPRHVSLVHAGDREIERVQRRTVTRASAAAFTDDAREIAIVADGDVWVMDTELREPKRVTHTAAEERDPVFSPDFKTLYFVSDALGTPDVFSATRADETKYWWQNDEFVMKRLTNDEEVEAGLRFTPDGKRISFVKGRGDLWTMTPDGTDAIRVLSSWNRPDYDFSPDGNWVAYALSDNDFNRDVFITKADGTGEPVNVSRHPDDETSPRWSPDGKVLAFVGRRWEQEFDIYYVWLQKPDDERSSRDRKLEKALEKMAGRKKKKPGKAADTTKPTAEKHPTTGTWSGRLKGEPPIPPDGLEITLVITRNEDESLVMRLEVPGQFDLADVPFTFDDETNKVSFEVASPLGLLKGEGTKSGKVIEGAWSIEGTMSGTFRVERQSEEPTSGDAGAADTSTPAAKKTSEKSAETPKPIEIDFDGIADRVRRITINDSTEGNLIWSHDSRRLAFTATVNGAIGTYTVTFPDELTPKLLSATRGSNGRWLKEGNQIVWLVGGLPATLSGLDGKPARSGGPRSTSYAFQVQNEIDLPSEHAAAFDVAWRIMRDNWYDARMNNRDWDAVRRKYRPMAKACLRRDELELVVNLMLGELNGSHLGFRASKTAWTAPGWKQVTGHLGLRYDPSFEGPGLRVRDVVPRSPADLAKHRIEAGEIVTSIDGRPVEPYTNLVPIMTGVPNRSIEVEVRNAEGEERTLAIRPTTYAAIRGLMYDYWIDRTRAKVDELSQGSLGYLHVRGMNWSSFQRFEAELYKAGHGKDGLIIDVRENGGGFTTDHLLTCLTQPRHAITVPRGGGPGYPQSRMVYASWHKPIVVLCNQNSFSNAEIFSHAIKSLKRGKVVGVQTAGGVVSTGGARVMGVGSLRLPFRGWFVKDTGLDMELNGCVPDITVWPEPGEAAAGKDRQLEAAVEALSASVAEWKARPRPKLVPASERRTK